ncbi:ribosome biogenesis GTP-binding protein YihA/YsxC [Candidatus Fukatsuia anoeciicola]
MITKNNYHKAYFITSAPNIHCLPASEGIEIAFVGYSNAGKSSALNTLINKKNLARISKIPGRTQLINLFGVINGIRLVDLPGYGYAKVPEKIKNKWQYVLYEYLENRNCLKGLVMLMDIRHPLKLLDQQIITWAITANIPILLLLTKTDKLALSMANTQLNIVRKAMISFMGDIQVEKFSSTKKIGINKLQEKLDNWFSKFSLREQAL